MTKPRDPFALVSAHLEAIAALNDAEKTLIKARDLLRRSRRVIEDSVPALNNDAGILLSEINDLLGD